MKLFQWRGRVSRTNFRRQYLKLAHERLPADCTCVESDEDELTVRVTGLSGYKEVTQHLDNAWAEFIANPKDRDSIYARWLDNLEHLAAPREIAADTLLPMVKSRGWLASAHKGNDAGPGAPHELLHDAINDELVVTYVSFGKSIHFLTRSDLSTLGLDEAQLRQLAMRNLRARTAPEKSFVEFPEGWLLNVGGNFEATMLIDDEIWEDARFVGAERIFAAVPDRNTIIMSVDGTVGSVWTLAQMAATLHKKESYPISPNLFVRCGKQFEHLDPAIEDLDHPIPRLDVIDVSVQTDVAEHVVLVVAAPLDGSPRSVYRLFRKLEGYLRHLGCDGTPVKLAVPRADRPKIYVRLHPDSHSDVIELLNSLRNYVSDRGGLLEIKMKV